MSEANKELVRRHFEEIFNHQNLAACDEAIAEDFIEHAAAPFAASAPGRVNGPAARQATAEWLLAQFPDLHMTIEAMVAERGLVAVHILCHLDYLAGMLLEKPDLDNDLLTK